MAPPRPAIVAYRARRLLLGCAIALITCAEAPGSRPEPPRRIYLVTIDTLRADRVGWHGYPRGTTPFLDRLAARGVVFSRAYASISHTAPSHASMFTGLQPAQHRLLRNGQRLSGALDTLAEQLRERGYRTAAFTPVGFLDGLAAGFDTFDATPALEAAPRVLRRARAWAERAPRHAKQFAWIHLFDVHEWYDREFVDASARAEVASTPPSGEALIDYLEREQGIAPDAFPRGAYLAIMDAYDAQVLSVDHALEDFHDALGRAGLGDEALWIVTSDHGEGLGNHGHRGHGRFVYDEQIHVPLLFHWSDDRHAPRRVDRTVRLVDLAPTLMALTGGRFVQRLPLAGRSLAPLLRDAASRPPPLVFSQRRPADRRRLEAGWLPGAVYALQDRAHKVIVRSDARTEFFDLRADPFEQEASLEPQSAAQRRMLREARKRYRVLRRHGRAVRSGAIPPDHVEALRALGYL